MAKVRDSAITVKDVKEYLATQIRNWGQALTLDNLP
jgi:hypothetical protein